MKGETASSVAGLVKDGTVASAAEDMGSGVGGGGGDAGGGAG